MLDVHHSLVFTKGVDQRVVLYDVPAALLDAPPDRRLAVGEPHRATGPDEYYFIAIAREIGDCFTMRP